MAGVGTTLVFLYGPPASGKLTVAQALAKLTGYRVFHNHLTIDLVRSLFDWGEGPFWSLVDRYRLEFIDAAAEAGLPGLIFTFVYARGADDAFVARIVDAVARHRGRVVFVRLTCEPKELARRVRLPSRRAYHKMSRVTALRDLLARHDLFFDVPYPDNLVIDTTRIRPGRTARMIAERFRLPAVVPRAVTARPVSRAR